MKYTIVLMEGSTPKRCIGVFNSEEEAHMWARADGWDSLAYKILELWP